MTTFQRIALTAYVCLEMLILFGAVVRTTGSGLGCPDWPRCYGCLIPPTNAAQIDFTKLDLPKFQKKAALLGEDPNTITAETLRARFNPLETWIEYLNRVSSIPLLIVLVMMISASFRQTNRTLRYASVISLGLFMTNAIIGFLVVKSLLKPNNVTLHMAVAIIMLCVLVYIVWRAAPQPWTFLVKDEADNGKTPALAPSERPRIIANSAGSNPSRVKASDLLFIVFGLFLLVIIEGIMGSQVRELTDELARNHAGQARGQWVHELEQTTIYLVHRSASWLLVALGLAFHRFSQASDPSAIKLQRVIVALIFAQMGLGIILSQIGILAIAQVAHIVLSSVLISALFLWLLAARSSSVVSTLVGTKPFTPDRSD